MRFRIAVDTLGNCGIADTHVHAVAPFQSIGTALGVLKLVRNKPKHFAQFTAYPTVAGSWNILSEKSS